MILTLALADHGPVRFVYRNHEGEIAQRTVRPKRVYFGRPDFYPEPQWLLDAFCCDRKAERTFALKNVIADPPAAHPGDPRPETQLYEVFELESMLKSLYKDYSDEKDAELRRQILRETVSGSLTIRLPQALDPAWEGGEVVQVHGEIAHFLEKVSKRLEEALTLVRCLSKVREKLAEAKRRGGLA